MVERAAREPEFTAELKKELASRGIEVVQVVATGAPTAAVDLMVSTGPAIELQAAQRAVQDGVPLLRLQEAYVPKGLNQLLADARVAEWPLLEVALGDVKHTVFTSIEFNDIKARLDVRLGSDIRTFSNDLELWSPSPWNHGGETAPGDAVLLIKQRDDTEPLDLPASLLPLNFTSPDPLSVGISRTRSSWIVPGDTDISIRYSSQRLGLLVTTR